MNPRAVMMSRHLGDVTDAEWALLHRALLKWLNRCDVAGSVAKYSLYAALDRERAKAKAALTLSLCPECGHEFAATYDRQLCEDCRWP